MGASGTNLRKTNLWAAPHERAPLVNKNISVQIIDDVAGRNPGRGFLAGKAGLGVVGKNNIEAAAKDRRCDCGTGQKGRKTSTKCYFDRGGFLFHGKIKALADAAREGGLEILRRRLWQNVTTVTVGAAAAGVAGTAKRKRRNSLTAWSRSTASPRR